MRPAHTACVEKRRCPDSGTFVFRARSLRRIFPKLDGKQTVRHSRNAATTKHAEGCPPAERKPRTPFEILTAPDSAVTVIKYTPWGLPAWIVEDGITGAELAAQADLQPEMKYFIAHVIVPILIQRYIADSKGASTPQSEVEE